MTKGKTPDADELWRRRSKAGKLGTIARIQKRDRRISDAISHLASNGQKVTHTSVAKLSGYSARTVSRHLKTEESATLIRHIDRSVSRALENLSHSGQPVTACTVSAATGYLPNVVQKRLDVVAF